MTFYARGGTLSTGSEADVLVAIPQINAGVRARVIPDGSHRSTREVGGFTESLAFSLGALGRTEAGADAPVVDGDGHPWRRLFHRDQSGRRFVLSVFEFGLKETKHNIILRLGGQ